MLLLALVAYTSANDAESTGSKPPPKPDPASPGNGKVGGGPIQAAAAITTQPAAAGTTRR
ncbi:19990_t:CDS:1, partial [Dentiscutata erythropus]